MRSCGCKKWKYNIDMLNMGFMIMQARGECEGYTGEFLEYCPWCAKKLTWDEYEDQPEEKDKKSVNGLSKILYYIKSLLYKIHNITI